MTRWENIFPKNVCMKDNGKDPNKRPYGIKNIQLPILHSQNEYYENNTRDSI
jgi:hypothetical protein